MAKKISNKNLKMQLKETKSVKGKRTVKDAKPTKSAKPIKGGKSVKSNKPVRNTKPMKESKPVKRNNPAKETKNVKKTKPIKETNQNPKTSTSYNPERKKDKKYDVAILGATGAVGEAMISILEERDFPVNRLYPLASERSAGETVVFKNKNVLVLDAANFDFANVDIALFSAGAEVSEIYAPKAAAEGCIVIDNTSKYRLDPDVPLIIPEVNANRIGEYTKKNIIANPNCSTIQMLVALKPLYDAVGIKRINIATYQSVSGTGKDAINELANQTTELLSGQPAEAVIYSKQIAFNVLPHCGFFQEGGYTQEEMKLHWETQKIFEDKNIKVNATAVRVPVFYGHSEAIHIETRDKMTVTEARKLLLGAPGVILMDDPKALLYPSPIPEASSTDAVYVGRLREDFSHPLGLNLWVVADNIRKGAALNAIQIAEILIAKYI